MQTILNLLTRSGVVYMAFEPALSPGQYSQLHAIANAAATAEELRIAVEAWARAEHLRVRFEE